MSEKAEFMCIVMLYPTRREVGLLWTLGADQIYAFLGKIR